MNHLTKLALITLATALGNPALAKGRKNLRLAQETKSENTSSKNRKQHRSAETNSSVGGSEAARSDKTAIAAVELIGFTLTPVYGARVGYLADTNLLIDIGYATGGYDLGEWEAEKHIYSLKAKRFLANSFYVDAGVSYEYWDVQYAVTMPNSFEYKVLNGSVANTDMEIHIGNQWQWDGGFTLGTDWVGYFFSISSSSQFGSNDTVDPVDKEREEDDFRTILEGSSLHLGRFYLGWAF